MYILAGVVVIAGAALFMIFGKSTAPIAGEGGVIEGEYSIESIMNLGQAYICKFEKQDQVSKVSGTVYTDGQKIRGTFDIQTQAFQNQAFTSDLIVKEGDTYTWTSLFPQGYRAKVAKSATQNATPSEQAQLVGTKDKMNYKCTPWLEVDPSLFELPTNVTFVELKA